MAAVARSMVLVISVPLYGEAVAAEAVHLKLQDRKVHYFWVTLRGVHVLYTGTACG
jgi:hypothetical protein